MGNSAIVFLNGTKGTMEQHYSWKSPKRKNRFTYRLQGRKMKAIKKKTVAIGDQRQQTHRLGGGGSGSTSNQAEEASMIGKEKKERGRATALAYRSVRIIPLFRRDVRKKGEGPGGRKGRTRSSSNHAT